MGVLFTTMKISILSCSYIVLVYWYQIPKGHLHLGCTECRKICILAVMNSMVYNKLPCGLLFLAWSWCSVSYTELDNSEKSADEPLTSLLKSQLWLVSTNSIPLPYVIRYAQEFFLDGNKWESCLLASTYTETFCYFFVKG